MLRTRAAGSGAPACPIAERTLAGVGLDAGFDIAHHAGRVQPHGPFRIEALGAGRGGQFKQGAPQFLRIERLAQLAHTPDVDRALGRQGLLLHLLPDGLGEHEPGQPGRQLLEHGTRDRSRAVLALGRLDLLPLGYHLIRRIQAHLAEDVGVPAHELVVDVARDVVEVEKPLLRSDLRVKHDLDQHVAQFLPHMRVVAAVDGVDQLAHLVDQATHEAGVVCSRSHGHPSGARSRAIVRRSSSIAFMGGGKDTPRRGTHEKSAQLRSGFHAGAVFRGPRCPTSSPRSWPGSAARSPRDYARFPRASWRNWTPPCRGLPPSARRSAIPRAGSR